MCLVAFVNDFVQSRLLLDGIRHHSYDDLHILAHQTTLSKLINAYVQRLLKQEG